MNEKRNASVFDLNGIPKMSQTLPLALQHVVAMIVGCVTPAIIVAGVTGASREDQIILIQAALLISAVATLCFLSINTAAPAFPSLWAPALHTYPC